MTVYQKTWLSKSNAVSIKTVNLKRFKTTKLEGYFGENSTTWNPSILKVLAIDINGSETEHTVKQYRPS